MRPNYLHDLAAQLLEAAERLQADGDGDRVHARWAAHLREDRKSILALAQTLREPEEVEA